MKATEVLKNEPLMVGGGIAAMLSQFGDGFVREVVATAVSYGIRITPEAERLIGTIVTILILVLGMVITRQFTTPAYKLDEMSKAQFRQPPPTGGPPTPPFGD